MALTKEQIFAASDAKVQKVSVPEWGDFVYLRVMDGISLDTFQGSISEDKDGEGGIFGGARLLLLILTLCDEKGVCLFEADDLDALSKKSGEVINRLFEIALELNGLTEDAAEELAKNSEGGQTADSGSP